MNGSWQRGGDLPKPKQRMPVFLAAGILIAAVVFFLLRNDPKPAAETQPSAPPAAIPDTLAAGDVITFGHYEQDNDRNNGTEAIEWQVLSVENSRALLISKYALDAKPFNENWTRVTWETCSLRKWLNGDFYNSAFSPAEQGQIFPAVNKNPDNPISRIKGGRDTKDQIFLLSIDETNSYFPSQETLHCRATAFAKANGSYLNEYQGNSWWWLRSRGSSSKAASLVLYSGYVNTVGYGVNNTGGYVRPAFWLNL